MRIVVFILFFLSTLNFTIAQTSVLDTLVASAKDSIITRIEFEPKKKPVYNSTAYELQKFKAFKSKISEEKNQKKYLDEIHSFTKDSLQILAVKLISIKELEEKNLLEKDLFLNFFFYKDLLEQLKVSDINPTEYLFLENKIALHSLDETEKKYANSKLIILILTILTCILLYFYILTIRRRHKTIKEVSLSRQETTIKSLILDGKSNKEIASELFISLNTVKSHITNIYQKLHVSNRNELALKFKK